MATIGEFISASRNSSLCNNSYIQKEGSWFSENVLHPSINSTTNFVKNDAAGYVPGCVIDYAADKFSPGLNADYYNEWNKQYGNKYTQQQYYNTMLGSDAQTGKPLFDYVSPYQNSKVGALDTFTTLNLFTQNQTYADGIIYNIQRMPMDQREKSPFIQSLRGLVKTLRKVKGDKNANKLDSVLDKLVKGVGTDGKNLLGTPQISRFVQLGVSEGLKMLEKIKPNAFKQRFFDLARERATAQNNDEKFQTAMSKYKANYLDPTVYSQQGGNALFGAFHNAAPWLTYGVPAAAIASLMGNNSLWAPVLGGAALFGGLGYAKDSGMLGSFGDSSFMQGITDMHSAANMPIQSFINGISPEASTVTSGLFGSNSSWNQPGQVGYNPASMPLSQTPNASTLGNTNYNFAPSTGASNSTTIVGTISPPKSGGTFGASGSPSIGGTSSPPTASSGTISPPKSSGGSSENK